MANPGRIMARKVVLALRTEGHIHRGDGLRKTAPGRGTHGPRKALIAVRRWRPRADEALRSLYRRSRSLEVVVENALHVLSEQCEWKVIDGLPGSRRLVRGRRPKNTEARLRLARWLRDFRNENMDVLGPMAACMVVGRGR